MAQISTGNLTTILDKIGRHGALKDGLTLAHAVATGGVYSETVYTGGLLVANSAIISALRTTILGLNDGPAEALLLPAIEKLYDTPPNSVFPEWATSVENLDAYGLLNNPFASGDRSGLDAMLRVLNTATPTLRVHEAFAKYLGCVSPNNVFTGLAYQLATLTITGATSGTFALTGKNSDGLLDTLRFAPGKVAIRNTKTEGLTSTVITVTCIKNGVATSVVFTVSVTTNAYLTAGDDTTLTMSGCTALVSISGGFTGDTFDFVILPDRAIDAV